MRSMAAALLVAALVALAGCGTASQATTPDAGPESTTDDAASSTATEATTTTTTEATTTTTTPTTTTTTEVTTTTTASESSDDALPPGVNESGLVDATALWQAHLERAYADSGYRHVLEFADEDGTPTTVALHTSANATRARASFSNETETSHAWFADGGNRSASWNDTSPARQYYERAGTSALGSMLFVAFAESYPETILQYGEFGYDGTVTRDGRTLVRLRATGVTADDRTRSVAERYLPGDGYETMDGTVLVTRNGFVTAMDVSLTPADGGASIRAELDATQAERGPDRPDWFEAVPDVTVSVVERTEYDRARLVAVENDGSTAIEAGTNVTVSKSVAEYGNVTLPESLAPGEAAYVYVVDDATALGDLRVAVGDRPTLGENVTDFGLVTSLVVTLERGPVTASYGIPEEESATNATWRALAPAPERAQSSNVLTVS